MGNAYKRQDPRDRKNAAQERDLKRYRRVETIFIDINQWPVYGLTAMACSTIISAKILKGCSRDTVMSIFIDECNRSLFTDLVENRLLCIFRRLYKEVILIEFDSIQEAEKRKSATELAIQRHKERLKPTSIVTNTSDSDTLTQ